MRVLDHQKEYVCNEVFRLEELQSQADILEQIALDDEVDFAISEELMDVYQTINSFIKNLKEQERRNDGK